MTNSIIRAIIAVVTFSIGIGFVSIFTANRHIEPVSVPEVQKVQPVSLFLPESSEPAYSTQPALEFAFDYDPKEFNPRGNYYILGQKPKDFREFDFFMLVTEETDGKAWGSAALGTKYFGKNEEYHIISGNGEYTGEGSVTKERLVFVASPISDEDFEFRFDGRFLKSGRISKAGKNQAVLKGKLTKLKNGVKIAEREVKFRIEYLGC
ncbi:MAG TPA: hypothetical protein VNI84_18515 [Pyrinomonadaceae bacterium]|nr:hypothetical protein [Pyrinomonadaceae bacterium]